MIVIFATVDVDGQRVIQCSVITSGLEALVEGTDGVGEVGQITQGP